MRRYFVWITTICLKFLAIFPGGCRCLQISKQASPGDVTALQYIAPGGEKLGVAESVARLTALGVIPRERLPPTEKSRRQAALDKLKARVKYT